MCYMHGMCFAMLTPMLYISVCRKICGIIRCKGFAHVLIMSSIALVHVGRLTERPTSATSIFPIFMVHVGRRFEGVPMRPCGDSSGGIVCKWSEAIVF